MRRLALTALAATLAWQSAAAQEAATYDCNQCTLSASLVCGNDGLTYQGACLAVCGGAGVAHPGPCGPPSSGADGSREAATTQQPFPADLHPIAGAFDLGAPSADAPPTIDEAAVRKYESEGLALVGMARVGQFDRAAAEAAAAAALAARAQADSPPPITDRRVLAVDLETGLLYASKEPVDAQADGGSDGAETPGEDGPAVVVEEDTPVDAQADQGEIPGSGDASSEGEMTPDFQPARWIEFGSTPPQPYRRAVWLDFGCSGAAIGPHAVGTAAHCLYSVGQGFYSAYTARPGAYRPAGGAPRSPFGAYQSTRFIVLAGWSGAAAEARAWAYDAGVVITRGQVSKDVGTMGFAWSRTGPTGTPLMTAGYPQTTQSAGKFVRYRTPCYTNDANGRDVSIRADISKCAIAEGGQSGSPLWVGGGAPIIRAVLSRGTDDYDIWAELSEAAYNLWQRSKGLTA